VLAERAVESRIRARDDERAFDSSLTGAERTLLTPLPHADARFDDAPSSKRG
jgi:hypothetical protein